LLTTVSDNQSHTMHQHHQIITPNPWWAGGFLWFSL